MPEPDSPRIHPSVMRLYAVAAAAPYGDDTPTKVAKRLNISIQTLHNWEDHRRGVSKQGALIAQQAYGCDANDIRRDDEAGVLWMVKESIASATKNPSPPKTWKNPVEKLLGVARPEIPDGYVRFQRFDVSAGAGPGVVNQDFPAIVQTLEIRVEEAMALVGKRQTESIVIAGIATDSMEPTLNPKDLVFIDTAINHLEGDGVYFFVYDDALFCKRLQKLPMGRIAVISDNPKYKEWCIERDDPTPWRIVARVLSTLPLKVKALA